MTKIEKKTKSEDKLEKEQPIIAETTAEKSKVSPSQPNVVTPETTNNNVDKTQILKHSAEEQKNVEQLKQNVNASSITSLNEQVIKQSTRRPRSNRTLKMKQDPMLITRAGGRLAQGEKADKSEGSAISWLAMRADKEKEKVKKEKNEILKDREQFDLQRREFEEAQEIMRLEEEKKWEEEAEIAKKKKTELKELAKMFENL